MKDEKESEKDSIKEGSGFRKRVEKIKRKVKEKYDSFRSKLRSKKIVDIIFVVNPVAGDFEAKEKIQDLIKIAKANKLSYKVVETKPKKEVLPKNIYPKMIVALGGDGTTHKIVNEMLNREIDSFFVPIPAGTGNDFPESQGMSRFKFRKFIEKHKEDIKNNLLNNIPYKYSDVGKITYYDESNKEHVVYFINVAGINSFDAEVVKNLYETLKDKAHHVEDYILPIIKAVFKFKYRKYHLEYRRGKKVHRFNSEGGFIIFNNFRFAGGNLSLPEAKIDDGLLNIVFYHKVGRWNIPKQFFLIMKHFVFNDLVNQSFANYFKDGKIKEGEVIRDAFKELRVSPVYIFQCDGELYNIQVKEMKIEVVNKAIKIPVYKKE